MYRLVVASLLLLTTDPDGVSSESRNRLVHLLKNSDAQDIVETGKKIAKLTVYKDNEISSSTYGLELCVLHIRSGAAKFNVLNARVTEPPRHAYERLVPKESIGAITGGFFAIGDRNELVPIGLVKVNGKTMNRAATWKSGGVLYTTQGGISIVPIESFRDSREVLDAVQSKPLLIEDGVDGIRTNGRDWFDRSAIAITETGDYVLAVLHAPSGNASSLAEFSYLLSIIYPDKSTKIKWAIAMDGGPGAHLYVPKLKKHCGDGSPNYIPNIVYASP